MIASRQGKYSKVPRSGASSCNTSEEESGFSDLYSNMMENHSLSFRRRVHETHQLLSRFEISMESTSLYINPHCKLKSTKRPFASPFEQILAHFRPTKI